MYSIKKSAVLVSVALFTFSCQPVSVPSDQSSVTSILSVKTINGKVEFPINSPILLPSLKSPFEGGVQSTGNGGEFSLKATQTDISKQAIVSLIYTSDYSGINGTTYRNKTIATGLSQDDGSFVVKPGVSFSPELNMVYVLEATRRIGSSGNDNMALRTYLKWNGAGWESMTTPGVYINATTTALAIIQDNLKYKLSSNQTIGKIDTSSGSSVPQNIGSIDKIVFSSNRDAGSEIYSMNTDGTLQTRLTTNLAGNSNPSFSPDASKIIFSTNKDGNYEIYSMNSDGSNPIRLTNNTAEDNNPSFSPDGSKIGFHSFRDGNYEIYFMNTNGTVPTRLTSNGFADQFPVFSPDGTKIVFVSNRDGNYEIYSMNIDGSNLSRLTNNTAEDNNPSFSPDGTKIAFISNRDGNYEIYIMNMDGTGQTRLTNNSFTDIFPSFSADGTKISFESNRDGNYEIYSMNVDGSNQVNLTNYPGKDEEHPGYSFYINSSTVTNVVNLVNNVLSYNHDPMEYIKLVNGKYLLQQSTKITSVIINKPPLTTLNIGDNLSLTSTVTMFDNAHPNTEVTWSSSDNSIATVDNTGKVTPLKIGNVNITSKSIHDNNKSDTLALNIITIGKAEDKIVSWDSSGIYMINGDGTGKTYVVPSGTTGYGLSSPWPVLSSISNTRIVFQDDTGRFHGKDLGTGLIKDFPLNGATFLPYSTISPNGGQIAYTVRESNDKIYIYNYDSGTSTASLSKSNQGSGSPTFIGENGHIAWITSEENSASDRGGTGNIMKCDTAGSDCRQLTNHLLNPDVLVAWLSASPDGTKIAFRSNRDGKHNIHIIDFPSGYNEKNLTLSSGIDNDGPITWSKDNKRIYFNGGREVMNIDGSNRASIY